MVGQRRNVMSHQLTAAQLLKFELLDKGLTVSQEALSSLAVANRERSLSPRDYASTSGVVLKLEDDVWVNAPVDVYNPNFVSATPYELGYDDGFYVEGNGLTSRAAFWLQPKYHGTENQHGPLNRYVFTHGDRARLAPVQSCSMTCTFCNIPYDYPIQDQYLIKSADALVLAARTAITDEWQPAHHVLISGGTPKPKDIGWLRETYTHVLTDLHGVQVDLMMVPLPGLFDLPRLAQLGVHEFSINIELFNRERAQEFMRQKYRQGLNFYLDFIEQASAEFGRGRVRSMLMVGLEPLEDTLRGVRAIAERGGTPVLSPFRPDPVTPLASIPPPESTLLREAYLRAKDIVAEYDLELGPDCPPCTHNTLSFGTGPREQLVYRHEQPVMAGDKM